jgi:hypothetical protein
MGARPSTNRKAGGGFLNGTDGKWVGYRWTDEFNSVPFKPGKKADGTGPKFHALQFEIAVRVDGADANITQNLFAGCYDDYEVSEDGLTLTAIDGGQCSISASSAAGKYMATLVNPTGGDTGFPEERFSDDNDSINYEVALGTRVRFGQQAEYDKAGKPKMRLVKTGKFAGKTFPVTTTIIEQVYDLPAVKAGKSAGKAATKGSNGKAAGGSDVTALATATLLSILESNNGSIAKAKLNMRVVKALLGNPASDSVRKLLNSDTFYAEVDGVEYNEETSTISLSE